MLCDQQDLESALRPRDEEDQQALFGTSAKASIARQAAVAEMERRRQLMEEKLRRKIEDNRTLFESTLRQTQPGRGAMTERRIVLLSEVRSDHGGWWLCRSAPVLICATCFADACILPVYRDEGRREPVGAHNSPVGNSAARRSRCHEGVHQRRKELERTEDEVCAVVTVAKVVFRADNLAVFCQAERQPSCCRRAVRYAFRQRSDALLKAGGTLQHATGGGPSTVLSSQR